MSTGEVLVAMDDDDVYGSGYIGQMVKFLQTNPSVQLTNLDGYINMEVLDDGTQRFGTGSMGKRTGATFAFRRSLIQNDACQYTNKTGSDEWNLYNCAKTKHGEAALQQTPYHKLNNKDAYVKTSWAFQTVMEKFDNPLAAKALDFKVKKGIKEPKTIEHEEDKTIEISVQGKKHRITLKDQYPYRVEKAMAIADLMLSDTVPMGQAFARMKETCLSSGDWHMY